MTQAEIQERLDSNGYYADDGYFVSLCPSERSFLESQLTATDREATCCEVEFADQVMLFGASWNKLSSHIHSVADVAEPRVSHETALTSSKEQSNGSS